MPSVALWMNPIPVQRCVWALGKAVEWVTALALPEIRNQRLQNFGGFPDTRGVQDLNRLVDSQCTL